MVLAARADAVVPHRDEPLAQYLALHSSPVLRKHAAQWAVGSVQWGDGFLRHLAVTHALLQRWQNQRVLDGTRKQRQDAINAALEYVKKNPNTSFSFALAGLNEADARTKVEAQGCVLKTDTRNTSNPNEIGKVLAQNPDSGTLLAKGSPVNATIGVQVLGQTVERQPTEDNAAPTLAKTGGVALAGLALWLLVSGLLSNLAGSERLWRLARRLKG